MNSARLTRSRRAPSRRLTVVFAGAAVVLVPWTVMLSRALPSRHETVHWNLAWVGFDAMLVVVLALLASALLRRSPWLPHLAVATAALLACDTWFDMTTATPRRELVVASLEAALVELPLAALCLLIAIEAERVRHREGVRTPSAPTLSAGPLKEVA